MHHYKLLTLPILELTLLSKLSTHFVFNFSFLNVERLESFYPLPYFLDADICLAEIGKRIDDISYANLVKNIENVFCMLQMVGSLELASK